jgi:hypothetical protein
MERERERGDKDPYRGWFRFFWTALLEEEVFQACVFFNPLLRFSCAWSHQKAEER